jgi:hypothetical protein
MHFLCLVHVDKDLAASQTPAEEEAFERENAAYANWLARGPSVISASLHEPETATLIRSRRGTLSMTDGPYVETKEHIAGFMVIEASSREEAVEIAARSPVARIGTIEVREMNYERPRDGGA